MPKNPNDFIDWSDHKPGEPEAPQSRPLEKTGKGKDVINQQFAKALVRDDHRRMKLQPTDQELFGHLVVTPEQMAKMESDWEGTISNFYKQAAKPVEKTQTAKVGRGPIHKEVRTEEEIRISQIQVSGSDTPDE